MVYLISYFLVKLISFRFRWFYRKKKRDDKTQCGSCNRCTSIVMQEKRRFKAGHGSAVISVTGVAHRGDYMPPTDAGKVESPKMHHLYRIPLCELFYGCHARQCERKPAAHPYMMLNNCKD